MKSEIKYTIKMITILLVCFSIQGQSQDVQTNAVSETKPVLKRKGSFFFSWGYNRAAYSKSDMHFWGNGYDFVLSDVAATDAPTKDLFTYIKPNAFTVPQYNYRLGYYLTDKVFVSLGSDHMKYVIEKQASRLSGKISSGDNQGNYNHTEVVIGEGRLRGDFWGPANVIFSGKKFTRPVHAGDVLHSGNGHEDGSILDSLPGGIVSGFEHCDGLNDVSLEIGGIDQLWISNNTKHGFVIQGSIGLGVVIPDTEAYVLGEEAWHNKPGPSYHVAGYSTSGIVGIQFHFYNHFFLQARIKGGYINLPDIRTSVSGGKASQHFLFLESICTFGFSYAFGIKNK